MSAPELNPVEKAMHDILRRVLTQAVLAEAPKNHYFGLLTEDEQRELRMRLIALSNLHAAIKSGAEYPDDRINIPRLRGWLPAYLEQLLFYFVPDFGQSHTTGALRMTTVDRCQVVDPIARMALVCGEIEGSDLKCEAAGPGEYHDHGLSEHTKLHAQVGAYYSCNAVDVTLREAENRRNEASE